MVELIRFAKAVRQQIQPWIDRLLLWKEASDDWWGVRNERCAMPCPGLPGNFLQAAFRVAVCSL